MHDQTVTFVIPAAMSDRFFETSLATIEMDLNYLPQTVSAELLITSRESSQKLPTVSLKWNALTKRLYLNSFEGKDSWTGDDDYELREESRFVGPCVLVGEGEHLCPGTILNALNSRIENADDFRELKLQIIIV